MEGKSQYFFLLISGIYALKPQLPAVGGGEGVGVVTKVGAEVTSLSEGDFVIPTSTGLGMCWLSGSPVSDSGLSLQARGVPRW